MIRGVRRRASSCYLSRRFSIFLEAELSLVKLGRIGNKSGHPVEDVRALLSGELTFVETEKTDFAVGLEIQRQFGPLTIDSVNLAVARRCGINEIAAAVASFDQVPGLIVCKPSDVCLRR
jgi:hypothetical protein